MSLFSPAPAPRKGMPEVQLDEAEFKRRFRAQMRAAPGIWSAPATSWIRSGRNSGRAK